MGRGVGARRAKVAGLPPASAAGRCRLSGCVGLVGMAGSGLSRRDCPSTQGAKRIRRTERTLGDRTHVWMVGPKPEAIEGLRGSSELKSSHDSVVDDSSDAQETAPTPCLNTGSYGAPILTVALRVWRGGNGGKNFRVGDPDVAGEAVQARPSGSLIPRRRWQNLRGVVNQDRCLGWRRLGRRALPGSSRPAGLRILIRSRLSMLRGATRSCLEGPSCLYPFSPNGVVLRNHTSIARSSRLDHAGAAVPRLRMWTLTEGGAGIARRITQFCTSSRPLTGMPLRAPLMFCGNVQGGGLRFSE